METVEHPHDAPLWIRRPALLHGGAYALAALVLVGQVVAVAVDRPGWPTLLAVLLAGVGVVLSWRGPWLGLVVTGGASFAVIAVGRDPLSVWMLAVLVLFSATLRGVRAVPATAVVAACLLASFMSVGGFRGGAFGGAAALFSAVAGGATGAALRHHADRWRALARLADAALATREVEATRRVTEERLRIARDLHDVVGDQVAMLSVHLGVAEVGLPADADASRAALASARASGRTVVVETQRILALLRRGDDVDDLGGPLRPTPSLASLDALVASFTSIGLEVRAVLDVERDAVDASVGVACYRVVQEALTNAHRHGSGAATLDVVARDGRLQVVVENPTSGRGSTGGGGLGLVGMRERVEAAGGRLTIVDDGGRFRVCAELDAGTGAGA